MRSSVFFLAAFISTALAVEDSMLSLVFPLETSDSLVEMTPLKPLQLSAFTLCMRVATELHGKREIILFAYRTRDYDALNVWRELDGRLSFYLSGPGLFFAVPELTAMQTHVCVAWDSMTGAANFFIDGKKSLTKVFQKGHIIPGGGTVILGQDPDSSVGEFDAKQSFVGEISDLNMWDSVLSDTVIQDVFNRRSAPRGNVFDWQKAEVKLHGTVYAVPHKL